MGKLEDFLKEHKTCYEKFCEVVMRELESKINVAELMTYKFDEQVNKIISGFLKNKAYERFTLGLDRDDDAEKDYLEKLKVVIEELKAAKATVAKKGIEDATLCKKMKHNFDKIRKVFEFSFRKELFTTSIIKQCEKRYQIRIEKYPFPKDQEELIYQGLFLMMILHKIAKEAEASPVEEGAEYDMEDMRTKAGLKRSRGGNGERAAKKLVPREQHLDSIYNNPTIGRGSRKYPCKISYMFPRDFSKEELQKPDRILEKLMVECYADSIEKKTVIPYAQYNDIVSDISDYSKHILSYPQFREEVQEKPHKMLITLDNKSAKYDPYIWYIFGRFEDWNKESMLSYPYFFKGSEKKALSINFEQDQKQKIKIFENIIGYTFPKTVNVFEKLGIETLDRELKTVYFRDVTEGKKKYRELSPKNLHETANAYMELLDAKIIRYIAITYQCEKDHILVSFKTNNFELPPMVCSEEQFKQIFHLEKNSERVLYRGLRDSEHFEDMKKRGISYNTRKHNEQLMGPGVYWTEDKNVAKNYGVVVAMAIACEDLPETVWRAVSGSNLAWQKAFLMRDNGCLVIREKAIVNEEKFMERMRSIFREEEGKKILEELKKSTYNKNIIFCKTDAEAEDWFNCR